MIERIPALETTLRELVAISAPSREEDVIASFSKEKLKSYGFQVQIDAKGNVIAFLEGNGKPILLNAHLDRNPPGKGNIPIKEGNVLRSDGTTNLGADDTAGVAIILETAKIITQENKKHPPIVIALTREEEIGLFGAKALNLDKYHVREGLVFDNAFEPGTVVSRGAAYVAFDVIINGKSTHPGKDLDEGINVIRVFQEANIPLGETDKGQTRINIGKLNVDGVRNAVPAKLETLGEIRSFLNDKKLKGRVEKLRQAFEKAATKLGATISFTTNQLAFSYEVDSQEPLVKAYQQVVENRGGTFALKETFVASDANALRAKGIKAFVISTGVKGEHSTNETVNLDDLVQLTNDLVFLLEKLGN